METINRQFGSLPEDEAILKRIYDYLITRDGKSSLTAAYRYALREAAKGLPK